MPKKNKSFSNFSNVRSLNEELVPEEFPEGPLGSTIDKEKPTEGKSGPWLEGQHRGSAFVYPDKEQHDDLPRKTPGAHPLHDGSEKKE
ncbi:hypothetical protein [Lentibacillus sediminis]|uniref:hypothetical protein n=1 Tax=Lentibacillus sediminis TaxID=1940529 RepID=UPI000C1C64DD|nr:hypothetical protein [Lentibacillus sediminis]